MSNQRYMQRGVSASKEDVHNSIKNIDKVIFPQAFCKIIPDILGGDPEYCNKMCIRDRSNGITLFRPKRRTT